MYGLWDFKYAEWCIQQYVNTQLKNDVFQWKAHTEQFFFRTVNANCYYLIFNKNWTYWSTVFTGLRPNYNYIDWNLNLQQYFTSIMPYYGLFWTESPYPDLWWRFRSEHYFLWDHIVDNRFLFHDPLWPHNS